MAAAPRAVSIAGPALEGCQQGARQLLGSGCLGLSSVVDTHEVKPASLTLSVRLHGIGDIQCFTMTTRLISNPVPPPQTEIPTS